MSSLSPYLGNLGKKNAAHLLRRLTFGASMQTIDNFSTKTVNQAINDIFADIDTPAPPIDPLTGSTWLNPKPDPLVNSEEHLLQQYFQSWHLEQIRKSGTLAKERIAYFYHTHLPVQKSIVHQNAEIYYQNTLFRYYAYGNFKELMKKICIDNAMLHYIDNFLNETSSPNENYAREFMELYTIGKGEQIGEGDYTNYTEDDVQTAAKVLSGYKTDPDFATIDEDTGIPRGYVKTNSDNLAYLHNPDVKTFSDKFQNTQIQPNDIVNGYATKEATLDELDQFVEMIFSQDETAKFLCRKIYRQFVYHKITDEIETDIIAPLAETFRDNDYEIVPVLERLFKSQHFYDTDNSETPDDHIGALIKSPIDLVIGTLNFFEIELPNNTDDLYEAYTGGILKFIEDMDMNFYEPIDVAGYPPYHQTPTYNRYWISAGTIGYRYEFGALLVDGNSSNLGFGLDITTYVDDNISDPSDADTIVSELTEYMFPKDIPQERFDYFLDILTDKLSKQNWKEEWNKFKATNDNKAVKIQLEKLIISLLQSPEYQLF